MDEAVSNSVAAQLRAAFPEGVFTQVDVLGYGDDPDVEPGETAIRAFVDRGGQPAETFEDDEEVMQAFEEAHRQAITWLHRDGQLPIHRLDPAHPRHPGPARSWRCPLGLP